MAATLPAEITDRIIDFLHSDKHALSECSLVCESWIPASRYHLFRNFTIGTYTKAESLELFRSTATKDNTGASGELSSSISNMTGQLPGKLEVFNYVESVSWSTYTKIEAALEDSVMQIIASFPQLSEFSITNAGSDGLPLGYLRNIKKYSNHCCYYSTTGTATVIANNPGLEHLEVSNTQWADIELHVIIPPSSPPLKLRHLGITGFHFHLGIMPHLRSLTSLEWVEQLWQPRDLSAELWQTLKSDKIQLSRLKTSLMHDSLLDFLSSFQGMKDLRLVRIIGGNDEDSNRLARTLFQVVLQNHADTLEAFHINACRKGDWNFVNHDITPISNCANLRELGTSVYWLDNLESPDVTPVNNLLNGTCELPRLRLLQIKTINNSIADSRIICDAICRFDPGPTRIPVSNVYVGLYSFKFEWREGKYKCSFT